MSVAPLIPAQESSSAAGAATPNARPKRITPPAHWKDVAPALPPKKATPKAALPVVAKQAPALAPRAYALPRGGFIAMLVLGVVALNALLFWLFPLPALQTMRREPPHFSAAPSAYDSELPVWLRP